MGSCFSDENEDKLKIAKKEALKNKNINSNNNSKITKSNEKELNQNNENCRKLSLENFFIKSNDLTYKDFPIYPEKFKDLPYYEEEIYVGEGVQKDKAYKTNLYIDNITELRISFWNYINDMTKVSIDLSKFVKNIKNACMVDSGKLYI